MKKLLLSSFLVFATTFLVAPSAMAHDEVVDSYPSSGETVEAGQIGILVDFSKEVMANEGNEGFEIRVSDSQGNIQPVGCLEASGITLSSTTSLAAAGDYLVDWRSVGNDGHAIEGSFKFTLVNTSGYEQETAEAIACATAFTGEAPVVTSEATRASPTDAFTGLLVGAGLIVFGTVAGAVVVRFREKNERNRPKKLYED